ncbi:hypothetical protein [Hyphococcus sp.]|jgi:hypothetical protein|uniref:hypothetical protein n=1 Tax=Hyphococcus sp. TaxID=2038636 RepID=UPI003D0E9CE6
MKRLVLLFIAPLFAACASPPVQDMAAPAAPHKAARKATPLAKAPVLAAPAPTASIASEEKTSPPPAQAALAAALASVTAQAGALTDAPETPENAVSQFAQDLRRDSMAWAILPAGGRAYEVEAELVELKQPFAGLDMTVTAIVAYKVKDASSIIYEETVEAAYTAKAGEAMTGVERLRIASDGAVRKNISVLLERLEAARPARAAR